MAQLMQWHQLGHMQACISIGDVSGGGLGGFAPKPLIIDNILPLLF